MLCEESTLKNPENPVHEVKKGYIQFVDVVFCYKRKADNPVLNHVNLNIRSGQTIGVIGGTGSSKSSLVQLIPRLYDVTEGRVLVGDVDVRDYDIESLRNEVAMVLQKNVLFSGTIKENLRWGDENATDEEIQRVCRLACADEFVQTFPDGYDTYIEQGGTNVSGGQKQRLCIARALAVKPEVLLMDEATSALDIETEERVLRNIMNKDNGRTCIVTTHRPSVLSVSDHIYEIKSTKLKQLK